MSGPRPHDRRVAARGARPLDRHRLVQRKRARTIAIARGALKPGPDDPRIWGASFEALGRLMTEPNTALLARIRTSRLASIKDLSRIVARMPSNLLRAMRKHGLVRLRRDRGRALQPEVPFDRIEVGVEHPPMAAERGWQAWDLPLRPARRARLTMACPMVDPPGYVVCPFPAGNPDRTNPVG